MENSENHNFCPNCGTRQGGHDPEDDYRQAEKLFHGEDVPKNFPEAAKLFRKAAEQGQAYAQYRLGGMYDKGLGVLKDEAEAVKWYRWAAEQGHANAQFNLGLMHENGGGVPYDGVEAEKWYRMAAYQGDVDAKEKLDGLEKQCSEV